MKYKITTIRNTVGGLLLFFLLIFPWNKAYLIEKIDDYISPSSVEFDEPVTWNKKSGDYLKIIDNQDYYFRQGLEIEEGVQVLMKNGARIIIEGDFEVYGIEDDPVVFKGIDEGERNFDITVIGNSDVIIESAIFEKGGYLGCSAGVDFLNKAIADDCRSNAALNIGSDGDLSISNSIFAENYRALNIGENVTASLKDNYFYQNIELAVDSVSESLVLTEDNCWMRPSGPSHDSNSGGRGEIVQGNFNFNSFKECGSEFKPIILVPGLGGSWNWNVMLEKDKLPDYWDFMPFVHGYDSWMDSLEELGYEENRDYFVVYYDWRKDINENAKSFLKSTVQRADEISYDKNFDIVAHSMGGLLSLDYIAGDKYEDNINKVVLQGTPLFGSSKAYSTWEGGVIPSDWWPIKGYLWFLSKNDSSDLDDYDLIHKYIPSVKQLLPVYNYIEKNSDGEMVNFWEMEEQNEYLYGLMEGIGLNENDFNFEDDLLVIEGTGHDTTKVIKVDEYFGEDDGKLWRDGIPSSWPLEKETDEGDGTVLNESSSGIPIFNKITLDGVGHMDLPAKAVGDTFNFLGLEEPVKSYPETIKDKLLFIFACPIDVSVEDSDGNVISKDKSEIDGAYYYSDGNDDGYKIIEIQNPGDGEYYLEIVGNGDGSYDGFIYNSENSDGAYTEISGDVAEGEIIEYDIDVEEDGIEVVEKEILVGVEVSDSSSDDSDDEDSDDDEDDEDDEEDENEEEGTALAAGFVNSGEEVGENEEKGEIIVVSDDVEIRKVEQSDESVPRVAGEYDKGMNWFQIFVITFLAGGILLSVFWTARLRNGKI